MSRYCIHCGQELPDEARFCFACGNATSAPATDAHPVSFIVEDPAGQPAAGDDKDKMATKKKKQSSLWGCSLVLLAVALIAAAALFTYNSFFHETSNALIPLDEEKTNRADEREMNLTDTAEEEEEKEEEAVDYRERNLRQRVQNIYKDVLRMDHGTSYIGRYCTERLQSYIMQANDTDLPWINTNFWLFSNDYDSPVLEQIKVKELGTTEAVVRIAVRLYRTGDAVNIIDLHLQKDDGIWLIDDFSKGGTSVRTLARRAVEEYQIRQEILEDTLD